MACKKRIVLGLEEKIEVIDLHKNGKSERKLAEQFHCGKTQINTILKNQDAIKKDYEENCSRGLKRKRNENFPEINNMVLEWFKCARSKQIPISGPMLKEKALEIAQSLRIEDFRASNGWLERFKVRHNINFRKVCGESADVNNDDCEDWKNRLPTILEGYDDRNIFNMDETGLFFRALPSKTMDFIKNDCKGGKLAKERLTIAFCTNALGEKQKPLIIGKAKMPRCFKKSVPSNITWRSSQKAWMTQHIYEDWLIDFNRKMSLQNRKVILFIDNASCHVNPEHELSNVKVCYLPPNTTSKLQPLDQGVIKQFKLEYSRRVLRYLIARIDNCNNAFQLVKEVTVSDAVSWIKSSWENVKTETIKKCFKSCALSTSEDDTGKQKKPFAEENDNHDDETIDDGADIEFLSRAAGIQDFDPDVIVTENIECYDDLSANWEKDLFEEARRGKLHSI